MIYSEECGQGYSDAYCSVHIFAGKTGLQFYHSQTGSSKTHSGTKELTDDENKGVISYTV